MRLVDECKQVNIVLLASKVRVTSLKAVTIPRLELQAVKGSIPLSQKVMSGLEIENVVHYYYTESEVVPS